MDALLALAATLLLLAALSSAIVTRAPLPHRTATRPAPASAPAPGVSVIIPARDEARNLPRLLASLARQTISVDVIVVDGGQNGDLASLAGETGARVVPEPRLAPGWVGKSWACRNGRSAARGEWLLFTDADTFYEPEAVARAVAEAEARGVGFLTGLTRQELGSFAERVCMSPMFTLVQAATGGGGERSLADPRHAVANGQFLLFRAATYDALGGHEAVKESVVEDLALARVA
ncbi:MAG TPA: glycosyltransferase, partial [Candidatus Thermoplasmatota archaeon]|nr:glycosyltransferase [Candidatus Thermoplasmatota archaeon]